MFRVKELGDGCLHQKVICTYGIRCICPPPFRQLDAFGLEWTDFGCKASNLEDLHGVLIRETTKRRQIRINTFSSPNPSS